MRFGTALLLLFLSACASAPAPEAVATPEPDVKPIVLGEARVIQSEILGAPRNINIWLPPSYGKGAKTYPVLYVVDGGLEQDFIHITGLAQLGAVAAMFREVIVVGVETTDRQRELTYPSEDAEHIAQFPTHGHSAEFRAYIRDEVMPLINASYRTSGENALIGESLAGLFITETFLRDPDLVDTYIAISPSLWWDNVSLGKEAAADLQLLSPKERKFYITVANEGGTMRDGVLDVVKALKKTKAPGLSWTFSDRPDLEHSTIYHREALEALVWAFPLDDEDAAH